MENSSALREERLKNMLCRPSFLFTPGFGRIALIFLLFLFSALLC